MRGKLSSQNFKDNFTKYGLYLQYLIALTEEYIPVFTWILSRAFCGEIGLNLRRNLRIFPRCHFSFIPKLFVILSLIAVASSTRSSVGTLVVGEDMNCKNEGEIVRVDFLTDNPCFGCVCRGGKVQCSSKCKEKPDCYSPEQKKGACCPECLGCKYGQTHLNMSSEWLPVTRENPCERMYCKDGIVTKANLQCLVPCDNPLPPSAGECCPSCSGCLINGTSYQEGQTFKPSSDDYRCTKCICQGGTITCSRDPCPVLPCKPVDYVLTKDGCCMECVGMRVQTQLLPGYCRHGGRTLVPGKKIDLDECTQCTCKLGTLVCELQTCPIAMPCPIVEYVQRPDECCPMCKADVPKDCFDAKGRMHKEGSVWSEGRDSCRICACANETITCDVIKCDKSPQSCEKGYSLEMVPGKCCKTCVKEPDVCSVFGDPHYRTFDGRPFNFQGDCRYIIAKDCQNSNFIVEVQNNAKTSTSYAWTKAVYLTLRMGKGGRNVKTVSLHQHLLTRVNGKKVSFPYISRTLVISMERHIVKVRTRNGLSLDWDGDSFLEVGVTKSYQRQLCGLCGNYNGFQRDDFIGGDGFFKFTEDSFAESWKTNIGKCTRRELWTRSTTECSRSVSQKMFARKTCFIFKTKEFQVCHDTVDPLQYYKSCITDTCECPPSRKCSCESIQAYTSACRRRGVKINWNRAQHCQEKCSGGKVYSDCGPSCVRTCRNYTRLKSDQQCLEKCAPGCYCPAGYVVHKRKCIRTSQCLKALKEDSLFKRKRRRKAKRHRAKRKGFD